MVYKIDDYSKVEKLFNGWPYPYITDILDTSYLLLYIFYHISVEINRIVVKTLKNMLFA